MSPDVHSQAQVHGRMTKGLMWRENCRAEHSYTHRTRLGNPSRGFPPRELSKQGAATEKLYAPQSPASPHLHRVAAFLEGVSLGILAEPGGVESHSLGLKSSKEEEWCVDSLPGDF